MLYYLYLKQYIGKNSEKLNLFCQIVILSNITNGILPIIPMENLIHYEFPQ